jgi:putative PIG3 family NAD(P)H quinone oxidoreductase
MKAVYIAEFGGPENLEIRDVPDPQKPTGPEVLVRVHAAGLNRADLLQVRGSYPPPPGYSPNIPGLEFAGEIVETGDAVSGFTPGDRVFGITAGEAQAELLITDASTLARVPDRLSLSDAGGVPEAYITAHDAIFTQGQLKEGETLLIHAVASGVGLAALQMAKARGCRAIGTSRTAEKLERCRAFGLDEGVATSEAKFAESVIELTAGRGADVVLDLVGGPYFSENLAAAAMKGRILLVGLTGGNKAELNFGTMLYKRLKIVGTVLRARPVEEKAEATRAFESEAVPLLADGRTKANVERVFPASDAREAYEYLASNKSFGKVVLKFGG